MLPRRKICGMEWVIPVNEIFKDEITKLSSNMRPPRYNGDLKTLRMIQEEMTRLIDHLGELSTFEQGLPKVITTAQKFQNSSHFIYVMKDEFGNNGNGELIGLLKVGRKKLYFYDSNNRCREDSPLCVLDFYILKSRQRSGFGKILFDYMLRDLNVDPSKIAIDGPSEKMASFLLKNYNIGELRRQPNNFAMSSYFFDGVPDFNSDSSAASKPATPTSKGIAGASSARSRNDSVGNIIHGDSYVPYTKRTSSTVVSGALKKQAIEFEVPLIKDEPPSPADIKTERMSPSPPPIKSEPMSPMTVKIEPMDEPDVNVKDEPEDNLYIKPEPEENYSPPDSPVQMNEGSPSSDHGQMSPPPSPAAGYVRVRRESQLTDKGYFDIKYYHNKLW